MCDASCLFPVLTLSLCVSEALALRAAVVFASPSLSLIHALQLRDEELEVVERRAAVLRPMHATVLVDQDRRVNAHLLEVVVRLEAPRVLPVARRSRASP